MPDDTAVVRRAREGDEDAWRSLYEDHVDFVLRIVRPRVPARDVALEVIQEAFLRASRSLEAFGEEDTFRSWLAGIAVEEAAKRGPGAPGEPGRAEPPAKSGGRAEPPRLTRAERAYVYEAVRRRRSLDPWRSLWKIVLAVALLLLVLGLWHLHRVAS